jgi:hypothetical protein
MSSPRRTAPLRPAHAPITPQSSGDNRTGLQVAAAILEETFQENEKLRQQPPKVVADLSVEARLFAAYQEEKRQKQKLLNEKDRQHRRILSITNSRSALKMEVAILNDRIAAMELIIKSKEK